VTIKKSPKKSSGTVKTAAPVVKKAAGAASVSKKATASKKPAPVAKKVAAKKPVAAPKPAPAKPVSAPAAKKSVAAAPAKPTPAPAPAPKPITTAGPKPRTQGKTKAQLRGITNLPTPAKVGPIPMAVPMEKSLAPKQLVPIPPKSGTKYSEKDLGMFKAIIEKARVDALEELRMLRERLEDLTNSEAAEESAIYSMHMAEQGSEAIEKEKTYAQIQRIQDYIRKLDESMQRIADKSYGICRMCGILIAKERLLAVPITTLSASYKIHQKCPSDGVDRIVAKDALK